MRSLPMNKKGVSPIIATLLLIVIAVSAAVVTFAFVSGFISTSWGSVSQHGVITYDSYVINASDQAAIYLRNIGQVTLNISAMYFDSQPGTILTNDIALVPGTVKLYGVQAPIQLDDGLSHKLRIACAEGTLMEISIKKGL